MRIRFRTRIESENLASPTILFDAKQDFTFGVSLFPTGAFRVKMSRTIFINVFGTIQDNPTRLFPVPET
jgi:hypothetical protein